MKCPICIQEVQPLDHQERWGPEFAHSRCIIAFNAGSTVQDAKLQAYIKRLEEESESNWRLAESAIGSCAEMSSRIQRLEEAGGMMERYCDAISADNWRKAKEAKP